jgi:type I restriction enzyme S subunit
LKDKCNSSNWLETTLGEMLVFQRGYDITKKEQIPGPYKVISSSGPVSSHVENKVKGPGVIIGRKGTLGTVFYSEHPFWPHDTTLWVKEFNGNDAKFAYYFLKTLHLEQYDCGASNPTLNRNHIHLIKVKYPNVYCQRKIAGILSTFDGLIENNTRRIKILEEMAQMLYQEWFVKFRFPGHEKVKMVESEIGMIPDEWGIKRLSEVVDTQYGYTESARELPVGPKYLRGTDINKNSYIDWDEVPFCPITKKDLNKYKLKKDDILVIRMADPGKIGIVERLVEAVFASYLIRLTIKSASVTPYYLFYFLLSDRYQNYINGASTGTTRKSASAGVITDIRLAIPPQEIISRFEKIIVEYRDFLNILIKKNVVLRNTRDLLLPKLISGELDVEDLDIDVGGD